MKPDGPPKLRNDNCFAPDPANDNAPVFVTACPRPKFKNVAFGIDDPAGHKRAYPTPDGATAVTDASTATAPTGTPHPPTAPP